MTSVKAQRVFYVFVMILLMASWAYADPPNFSSFSPATGATNVPISTILQWTASDPNPSHTLTYDVYYGKVNPPPLKVNDQSGTTYQPSLSSLTVYYWKIVAKDNEGNTTEGPVLTFTTENNPPQFTSFSPTDGASNVFLTPALNWTASDPEGDPVKYDVYFGTSSPPSLVSSNQNTRTYQPGQLTHMTTYYWRVVARDNHEILGDGIGNEDGICDVGEVCVETAGPILTFTTLNNLPQFHSFSPVHGATGINLTPTLTWSASDADPDDTLRYDVYFGVSSDPPLVSTDQTGTLYQPTGILSYSTRYYWKIIAKDSHNGETSTGILYFNTISTDFIVDHTSFIVNQPQIASVNIEQLGDGVGDDDRECEVGEKCKGYVYVAWEDTRNGNPDIYFNYSSDYGETWQATDIRLDTDTPGTGKSVYPQITCDNRGHVYVVWKDTRSGSSDVYFNYSPDYGVTWQSSDKKLGSIPYNPNNPQFPKIACDNTGHVYVAWNDNYFNTSANYGVSWLSQAKRISTAGGEDTQLLCDQNNGVYVVWRLGTTNVLFNYSTNAGDTWQSPDRIISSSGAIPSGGLSLTSDEGGRISCAWHDTRNNPNSPDVYFNSSSDGGNTWGSDTVLNTGTPGSTYSIYPEIAHDNSGNVYVAWYDRRNGEGDIHLNFYNGSWQNPDIRLDTDTAGTVDSGFPEVVVDRNANIYAIWSDNQTSIGPGLYLNYSLDNGLNWLSTNRKIASGGFYPQIKTDGDRLYIVRENNETDATDVMFTKLAPFVPLEPFPADGAVQISLNPTLSWEGGNLNLGDTLTYDVYFGTSNPPPFIRNQTGTTYVPGNLSYLTTYYWQIVSRDPSNNTTNGPIWSFRTVSSPPQFVSFSPYDGQTGILLPTGYLQWNVTDPDPGDTFTYDVYFGTTNPPPLKVTSQTSNTYGPVQLAHYTIYYWKIVAKDQYGSETSSPVLSFTTMNYPPQFNGSYTPANGATNIPLTSPENKLSWSASDPTPGDVLTFDVYFGTSSPPPLVSSNQTAMNYKPGQLDHWTIYYWKIVARDNHGAEAQSPILSFMTLNNKPTFISTFPAHQSIAVSTTPTLTWSFSDIDPDDTLTYDLYFGTVSPPPLIFANQAVTSYQPGQLSFATKYHWKIVARDNHGGETSKNRTFTTQSHPPQFTSFSPVNGATDVNPQAVLAWVASDPDLGDTLTYDIYFGLSSDPPLVATNLTSPFYLPETLPVFTKYYWKIIARDSSGVETTGPILSFTTGDRPTTFQSFFPSNLATNVSITPTLTWSASDPDPGDTLVYDVYFGTSSSPPLVASNLINSTYSPGKLLPQTTYFWKVVARCNHLVETSSAILTFTTSNQPYINNVSPNPCQTGQIITITGERFGSTQGASEVHLGKMIFKAGNKKIKMWSNTEIQFKVPAYSSWPSGRTRTKNLWIKVNGLDSNVIPLTITKP